jgi:hypothetical protein
MPPSSAFSPLLRTAGDMLVTALAATLQQQGHQHTGRLIRSLVHELSAAADVLQLQLYFEQYGVYVDQGVSAGRIPYTAGSGRKSSRYIRALMLWATQRGMVTSQRQAKQMAFAIAQSHKKHGMPGRGSSAYSATGSRTGFLSANRALPRVEQQLEQAINQEMEALLQQVLNNVKQQL